MGYEAARRPPAELDGQISRPWWLDCGVDSDRVTREANVRRVLVQPESRYRFAATGAGTHLRLGYASQTPQEIQAGANYLLEAIAAARRTTPRGSPRG